MTDNREAFSRLAELFKPYATLYAVGGYVRNALLGIDKGDLDICSELRVDTVRKILLNTDFVVLDKNLRVGTVIIKARNFTAEYTSFRIDSYVGEGGKHTPAGVKFTTDMLSDCRRRDFKMNAVYFDPLKEEYIDLLGGIADIKNEIISSADDPDTVFGADGLRILRLVRFAAELNFEIENETFIAAKKNADKVKDIAAERILVELDKIFVADTAYPELENFNGHFNGINLLSSLGLIDILLPEVAALRGLEQPKKYHLYDAYTHTLAAFGAAKPSIRWAALLHDIGKASAMRQYGNMHGHERISASLSADIFKRLKLPKKLSEKYIRLIEAHMVDIGGKTGKNKLKWFIAKNADIIEELCDLTDADCVASCGKMPEKNRIRELYFDMLGSGVPLSVKELKIDGNDMIALGVPPDIRAEIIGSLWRDTVMNENLNNRENALEYIERKVKNL